MGAWVYHTYNHFSELTAANLTLIPAAIVISVGAFLFIIGSLGCIAACKESKCLLAVVSNFKAYEPHHEKTNVVHMRKQRRRSASR